MTLSYLLPIHRPSSSDIADITKVFTTAIEQHHFTILIEEGKRYGSVLFSLFYIHVTEPYLLQMLNMGVYSVV